MYVPKGYANELRYQVLVCIKKPNSTGRTLIPVRELLFYILGTQIRGCTKDKLMQSRGDSADDITNKDMR